MIGSWVSSNMRVLQATREHVLVLLLRMRWRRRVMIVAVRISRVLFDGRYGGSFLICWILACQSTLMIHSTWLILESCIVMAVQIAAHLVSLSTYTDFFPLVFVWCWYLVAKVCVLIGGNLWWIMLLRRFLLVSCCVLRSNVLIQTTNCLMRNFTFLLGLLNWLDLLHRCHNCIWIVIIIHCSPGRLRRCSFCILIEYICVFLCNWFRVLKFIRRFLNSLALLWTGHSLVVMRKLMIHSCSNWWRSFVITD